MPEIYLDNAATTPVDPDVQEAMMPWMTEKFGNPGSLYSIGREARDAVEKARSQVAALINARPDQIIFTSGGCEANTLAIMGSIDERRRRNRPVCVTTPVEHESIQRCLAKAYPLEVVKYCRINVAHKDEPFCNENFFQLPRLQSKDPVSLVSLMLENNEVPIAYDKTLQYYLSKCKEKEALVHGDAVQALGSQKIDVRGEQIWYDMISMSSHKIHGPKGAGALYVKHPNMLSPVIFGGGGQEFGLRGGTENAAAIVGFGKACELLKENREAFFKRQIICATAFDAAFRQKCADLGIHGRIRRNGTQLSKVLSYTIDGIDAETLILVLDNAGVYISAGSACSSHEKVPSQVLKSLGLTDQQARSTIRVSFSRMSTKMECAAGGYIMADCVKKLLGGVENG